MKLVEAINAVVSAFNTTNGYMRDMFQFGDKTGLTSVPYQIEDSGAPGTSASVLATKVYAGQIIITVNTLTGTAATLMATCSMDNVTFFNVGVKNIATGAVSYGATLGTGNYLITDPVGYVKLTVASGASDGVSTGYIATNCK